MRIVFLGSGAFGLPTLERLLAAHRVTLVVSQPDRPAGRGRRLTPTPIAERAEGVVPLLRTDDVNAPVGIERIRAERPDAVVVIAFGQKLSMALLDGLFAVNLHGSLLPRHRGAAPVNWSILAGDRDAGVTAITLAQRMDAGLMLGAASTPIDPNETAGELHDRLAELGAPVMMETLARHEAGTLSPQAQDETLATRAPKLGRDDAWLRFDVAADQVRRRVHGLTPWPGISVRIGDGNDARQVRLLRVVDELDRSAEIGTIDRDGWIGCAVGTIRILELQPAGGRPMPWEAFARGHTVESGTPVESCVPAPAN